MPTSSVTTTADNEQATEVAAPNLIMRSFHILFVRDALDGGKSARLIMRGLMASGISLLYYAHLPHGIGTATY